MSVSDELPLAAASGRLRGAAGFPRAVGRPRKHADDAERPVVGHVEHTSVAQPRATTSARDERAGVRKTPAVAIEPSARAVVTVAPALLSVPDSARYLGVSARTIEAYVAAGLVVPVRLPSPRGGRYLGRVLLERASLDELVARARGRR
jgi:Helix-turn-helix domain